MVGQQKEKLLWGVPATATALDVDQKTVRKQIEAGKIPAERYGRNWKIPLWWIKAQRDGPAPGRAA